MSEPSTGMTKDRQDFVENIVVLMINALTNIAELSPIAAAYAFQQIGTQYLLQYDRQATAEILQAMAECARRDISDKELATRCHAPFDRICAAFDRGENALN